MSLLDPPGITPAKLKASRLLADLIPRHPFNPVVHPAPPTVTESTTQTLSGGKTWTPRQPNAVTLLGSTVTTYNSSFNYLLSATNGADASGLHVGFQLTGDTVELTWRAQASGATTISWWIWVDGRPISAAPTSTALTIVGGTRYYLKLAFSAYSTYDIRIYGSGFDHTNLYTPITQTCQPVIPRPWTIACVGDSFGQNNGTAGTTQLTAWGKIMCDQLGAEFFMNCQAGTGYTTSLGASLGPFGEARRIASLVAGKPDLIVVFGGVNDRTNTPSVVGQAVTDYLAAIRTALPGTPVIIAGPQPLAWSGTLNNTNMAQVNAAVRNAALAASNCLGHIDAIGNATTGTIPPTYAASTAYAVGDIVQNNGAAFRCIEAYTSSGSIDTSRFDCLSWFSGKGALGSTDSLGNRDVCLHSDTVHPTPAGQMCLGTNLAAQVARLIRATA